MNWLLVLVIALFLVLPASPAQGTDLGEGNAEVARRFEAWRKAGPRTRPPVALKEGQSPAHRVMLTGFGLFSGVDFNISGVVVESMADAAFWPDDVRLDTPPTPREGVQPGAGRLQEADGGARVWQRSLTIDGQHYEVAFVLLDVLWDLGPAIVLQEARTFRPELIVMTGRGGKEAVLEGGAVNRAIPHPGFRADGTPDPHNQPTQKTLIDPALQGAEANISATWDNVRLAQAARGLIQGIDPELTLLSPAAGRADNTYICNNVTHLVLHGLKGVSVPMAGGAIQVQSDLRGVKAGFFHYPAAAQSDAGQVLSWAQVLATIVRTHFTPADEVATTDSKPDAKPDAEPVQPVPGTAAQPPPAR